ncbi:replicative DNA helicase [Roseiconus nitratireducens]|uniref:replicative DNA helicase n=1 Tax=Roseiconus nitratireducens TaxID=2605748 RepID=UPI001375AD9E|nr:DnaB-like helicase C-terminal domain-containing protein [Roseiconus nitratireducens]
MRDITTLAAENGLLSSMLLAPEMIAAVEATLTEGDFEDPARAKMFSLLVEMNRSGEHIRDQRLLLERLRASGLLDELGGPRQFLAEFIDHTEPANAASYAAQVRRNSVRRRMRTLANEFQSKAVADADPADLAGWLQAELGLLQSIASTDQHASTVAEACESLLQEIRHTAETGGSPGVLTGIDHIDGYYGGLLPSRLYVIAARPGVGKSSLAQQVGEAIAANNQGVLFISLEMSRQEIAARYLAKRCGINGKQLAAHAVSAADLQVIEKAAQDARSLPFLISEPNGRRATLAAICAEARVRKTTDGIAAIVVDYLQIIEPTHPRQTEYEKVTEATRAFKQLSRELGIPVVLLSQLNRQTEAGTKPRAPRLGDLRSSGSIEQDADGVLFLHELGRGSVRLMVPKMRGGERSEALLRFHGPSCTFSDAPIEDHDNFRAEFADYATDSF